MKRLIVGFLASYSLFLFTAAQATTEELVCPRPVDISCVVLPKDNTAILHCAPEKGEGFVVEQNTSSYPEHDYKDLHPTRLEATVEFRQEDQSNHVVCRYIYSNDTHNHQEILRIVSIKPISTDNLIGGGWHNEGIFGARCTTDNATDTTTCKFHA